MQWQTGNNLTEMPTEKNYNNRYVLSKKGYSLDFFFGEGYAHQTF